MKDLKFGLFTLGDYLADIETNIIVSEQERIEEIIESAKLAEQYNFDFYSVGESHQEHFVSQAHALILAAIARETKKIRISSSATIVSTSDPVRVYENFATLDLLSNGRAEIVAGRASRVGLFNLLGFSLRDYEGLFEEKFELLLKLFKEDKITWSGKYRKPLNDMTLYPKPIQKDFPIWRAVGGTKESAILAGQQGVPMAVAMLAGSVSFFNDTINTYRSSLAFNHPEIEPVVAVNSLMYIGETDQDAFEKYYNYINYSLQKANGNGMGMQVYQTVLSINNVMLVGSPETIIKKLVHQFRTFKHTRHQFQIDIGGMPFKEVKRMIKILGEKIIPEVKKQLLDN